MYGLLGMLQTSRWRCSLRLRKVGTLAQFTRPWVAGYRLTESDMNSCQSESQVHGEKAEQNCQESRAQETVRISQPGQHGVSRRLVRSLSYRAIPYYSR